MVNHLAKKAKQSSTGPFSLTSFLAGIVVGCVASIIVAATAVPVLDDYKPDTAGFPPNLDLPPKTTEYVFPDLLEKGVVPEELGNDRTALIDVASSAPAEVENEKPQAIDGFLLQVGSFEQQQHADTFRAWLILRGHVADVAEVEISGVGIRYRVVVGPFSSQEEANIVSRQLAEEDVQSRLLGIPN